MESPMRTICLVLTLAQIFSCGENFHPEDFDYGVARYVDPFIGTGGHGHVYPGATVPFGAVQLSPDNGKEGWDWSSGYHYTDSLIVGFSHTHLSGTGIGDLCDVLIMPAIGKVDLSKDTDGIRNSSFASTFKHQNEEATVGYYSVNLDNGIKAELTASQHVGFHKHSFPEGENRQIVLDLGYHINWDQPVSTSLAMDSAFVLTGKRLSTGWAFDQRVYFAMSFSENPIEVEVYDSTTSIGNLPQDGHKIRTLLSFGEGKRPLLLKVAISSASIDGARKALEGVEHIHFEDAKRSAAIQWINELSKIDVSTQDQQLLRTFYTALYHTYLAPVVFNDVNGQYKSPNGSIASADNYTRYDIFSLWDTFRAANPLLTITQPDRLTDIIKSMLAHYQEHGSLPVWSLLGNETNIMTGYHSIPIITDAILKGHRNFDVELAYKAMKASAMQDINGTKAYRELGYVPNEEIGESVTRTIEYAYDDWCLAQIAAVLRKKDEYAYFMDRAGNYKNLFEENSGFFRAKMANGTWKEPFDPLLSDHNFEVSEYTEGNAWQHAWFVPHDVRGLIELHGGNDNFVKKLDTLFTMSSELVGQNVASDITGMIGQYAHGNEPSHHIPYLFNYAGAAWKTQGMVREILLSQYNDTPEGLCGNEDCGQMSAWYVLSAMGFYPVNPAEGVYVIGASLFDKVEIDVGDGKSFVVRSRYNIAENKYVQAASLNDEPLTRSYLRHYEIMDGGELRLQMGPLPNYLHWSDADAFPPSASDREN